MNTIFDKASKTLISKKGIKELKKSISQLERTKSKTLRSIREIERKMGHDEKLLRNEKLTELSHLESELAYKKVLLINAQPLPKRKLHLKVDLGSVVDLVDQGGHLFHYTLVDSIEADPSKGRISIVSPIGKSLLGRTVRDIIKWTARQKTHQLRLVRIN